MITQISSIPEWLNIRLGTEAWHDAGIYFSHFCFSILIVISLSDRLRRFLMRRYTERMCCQAEELFRQVSYRNQYVRLIDRNVAPDLYESCVRHSIIFENIRDAALRKQEFILCLSTIICCITTLVLCFFIAFGWNKELGAFMLLFLIPPAFPLLLFKLVMRRYYSDFQSLRTDFEALITCGKQQCAQQLLAAKSDMENFLRS